MRSLQVVIISYKLEFNLEYSIVRLSCKRNANADEDVRHVVALSSGRQEFGRTPNGCTRG